ncbi:MAG: hypothetical protein HQK97_12815, partial [Nitrospirae bacterium]|nr:hypothetical protein [Nitrospirota bacterium]
ILSLARNTAQITAVNQSLYDYFSAEVFNALPEDTKEFLLKTAWLPEFTAAMADQLAPHAIKAHILTGSYFFTEHLTDAGVTYTCHTMFRDFLLRQSKDHYGQRWQEIALQAADVMEEHGRIEESAALAAKSGNWKRLEKLILTHAQNLIDEGRCAVVDGWLSILPREIVQLHPWLMYWQGLAGTRSHRQDSRKTLVCAFELFKQSNDTEGQLTALCAIIKAIVLEGRDYQPLERWIAKFEGALFEGYKCIGSDINRQSTVVSIFAALVFGQPDNIGLDYWLVEAERIVLYSKHTETRLFAGYSVIMYYLWTGFTHKAGVIVDVLSLPVRQMTVPPALRLTYLTAEALYFYYKLSLKDALKTIDEGLLAAEQTGLHHMDAAFLGVSVQISLAIGDAQAADVYLKRILPYVDTHESYASLYYQLSALTECSKGAHSSAIEYARRSTELVRQLGCQFMLGLNQYHLAYCLAQSGRYTESTLVLNDIQRLAASTKSELFEYLISAVKTLIYLKTDDKHMITEMFNWSANLAQRSGIKHFLPLNLSVAAVTTALLEGKAHLERVKELITLHSITTSDYTIEAFPWSMKIYTMGHFEVFQEGSSVAFAGKPHKMPLALLKAIIAFGGKSANSIVLSDLLWPDSDGDLAMKSLFTTLYRLRKILGNYDYVQITNGNLSLDPRHCWLDIWAFDAIVDDIYNKRQNGGINELEAITTLLCRMFSIYKGNFSLEGQNTDLEERMIGKLKCKLITCCIDAGEFLEKSKKYEHAIECYRKASMVYPSEEIFYQKLMRCKKRIGQDLEAILTYDMCKETLLSTTGYEPSVI